MVSYPISSFEDEFGCCVVQGGLSDMGQWAVIKDSGGFVLVLCQNAFLETSKPSSRRFQWYMQDSSLPLTEDFALVRVNAMVAMWCTNGINVVGGGSGDSLRMNKPMLLLKLRGQCIKLTEIHA
ncbi:hypothetical protein TorRG33x02_135390 [Trema orientale]|uniref:Uncharacterized protein n=1 Tax=Trema orientale TaxID=63057 RepID=A0A2P5EYS4_TREOI|nr:hypothetical protein TorRG33x02_135390 [Trema orientale]